MTPKHADEMIKQHNGIEKALGGIFKGTMASLASLTVYPSRISNHLHQLESHEVIAHHTTATGHRLELKDKADGRVYEVLINVVDK